MKVCVLLSSYNGEKYIEAQIHSILKQKGVDIHLLVRDDGSTDKTKEIIKKIANTDRRVSYIFGDNLRTARSFYDIAKRCERSDYYAFSDQDDVWEPNKILNATKCLKGYDEFVPLLYYSNLTVVDENLKALHLLHKKPHDLSNKYSTLIANYGAGCTMLFNNKSRELFVSTFPSEGIMHDTWMNLICAFSGRVYYDFNSYILYRQHSNNVIGVPKNFFERATQMLNRIFIKRR